MRSRSLIAFLRSLSVADLLGLVEQAPLSELRTLWRIAGYDEPEDDFAKTCCGSVECECVSLPVGPPPVAAKEWYFPEEVIEIMQRRLWPDEYGFPPEPPPTFAIDPRAKTTVLARRRGEGQEEDSAAARANPLLGYGLKSLGDPTPNDLHEHVSRPVHRLRNGAPVAGEVEVAEEDEDDGWSVARELAAWRAKQRPALRLCA